jgi:hypothetical protein
MTKDKDVTGMGLVMIRTAMGRLCSMTTRMMRLTMGDYYEKRWYCKIYKRRFIYYD